MKERDAYDTLSSWLQRNFYVSDDYLWNDTQIRFGSLKARCDIIGYELNRIEEEEPACNELTGIHLFECKFDYAAAQAYGQLLFYREIVERYMNSKHYDAFNTDFYNGIKKFFQRNNRLPRRWRSTFWLPSKIDLYLHLALLETEYCDEPFFKFVEGSLNTFLKGRVGFLILKPRRKKWRVHQRRGAEALPVKRKRGPKPSYQMEPLIADIFHETRLTCRWYTKEGKANRWCSEKNIDLEKCEACNGHIPV